jgi:hypothetical protein
VANVAIRSKEGIVFGFWHRLRESMCRIIMMMAIMPPITKDLEMAVNFSGRGSGKSDVERCKDASS